MVFNTISIIAALAYMLTTSIISIDKITRTSEDTSIEEVNREIERQDISPQLVQQQARIAQELAIAVRIETAEEVEIEEFYDNSGEGNAGLKVTQEKLSLGIDDSGRRITKRIYKFKGHNGEKVEVYQQKLNEILSPKT